MKKSILSYLIIAVFAISTAFTSSTKLYGQSSDSFEITIYRPANSMMSGGAGAELKVSINDQEIGTLLNSSVLHYTVFSEGELKIRFVGVTMGSSVGSPKVIKVVAKHGESVVIEGGVTFPGGANAKIVDAKSRAIKHLLNYIV